MWYSSRDNIGPNIAKGFMWLPIRILYCYPLMYWIIPRFLLQGRYTTFTVWIMIWALLGWLLNFAFRKFMFIPLLEQWSFVHINRDYWEPNSFLVLTTTAGITSFIILFKHWLRKQQEWLLAEKENISSQLQLLKAQVQPHFLFNTLNTIYAFALEQSTKTPGLVLKLSSLLSYMLYECEEEVRLDKEVEIMKNYVDLEKERYGDAIDISWSVEGEIKDTYIAPLLLLPFIENAIKHGMSEQLTHCWLSVDLMVEKNKLRCKIVNSKNDLPVESKKKGIGIENARRRLQFLYPDQHELKISDEGNFHVVSLDLNLRDQPGYSRGYFQGTIQAKNVSI